MFLPILMTVVLMKTWAVLVFRLPGVWLDIKVCKISLFPQKLQAIREANGIGIKG